MWILLYSTVDGDIVKRMVATIRVAVDASVVFATEDVDATDVEESGCHRC
jgi:hypothetical protein